MHIVTVDHTWSKPLTNRHSTDYIIIHHAAANSTVENIHRIHLNKGWSGIGYHYYIRKDGTIYTGRPIYTIGAHCSGKNNCSIGICFEGNFETETTMCVEQFKAGQELLKTLRTKYPNAKVVKHKDFFATACPGKFFPFKKLLEDNSKTLSSANDIIWELIHGPNKIEINEVDRAVEALEKAKAENSSLYWILYKLVNK